VSEVWRQRRDHHWVWGAVGSLALHTLLFAVLFIIPAEARDRILSTVDMQVRETPPPPPPEPEPEPEPEPAEEVAEAEPVERIEKTERPRREVRRAEEPEPEPQPQPETPPEPPPKFTMSGSTFADEGTWGLAAEVGDSRFGSLGGEGEYEPGDDDGQDGPVAPAPAPAKPKKPRFDPAKSSEVESKPKVILEQTIPYPPQARKLGIEGKVRLRVDIDEKGDVVKVAVLQDPGGGLGKAAAEALEGFKFSPAIGLDGEPVDYRITYVYVFTLE
jgi:protein TonB